MTDDLELFRGRSARGSAQASHNVCLLLLEQYDRKRGTIPPTEDVLMQVLHYGLLSLQQLDGGSDLSCARLIRESVLSKLLQWLPTRASTCVELIGKARALEQSTRSNELRLGLCLCLALCCVDPSTGVVSVERRSEALAFLKRGLHAGQTSESPSRFSLDLMDRVRAEQSKLQVLPPQ